MSRYVGARYVPIPDGAWDNTKEYEPLTMVQYEGDTYTSKMYVPVGIAITNTTYWVKTGNFNQQVANLAQSLQQTDNRVQDIEGDVEDLDREKLDEADLPDKFVIDTVIKVVGALNPGEAESGTAAISKPGYKAIGLAGWAVSIVHVIDLAVSASAVSYTVVNNRDTAITAGELAVRVLFVAE